MLDTNIKEQLEFLARKKKFRYGDHSRQD